MFSFLNYLVPQQKLKLRCGAKKKLGVSGTKNNETSQVDSVIH